MRFVDFVVDADPPGSEPRVGAELPDGTIVDLQAAHFAMTMRRHPFFASPDAFEEAGDAAEGAARRVVGWVETQRPPGATVEPAHARVVGARGHERGGRINREPSGPRDA